MIDIRKDSKYSVSFNFDIEDIEKMLKAFQYTFSNKTISAISEVQIEQKILRKRKKDVRKTNLLIKFGISSLYEYNDNCILELDEDDLEYGIALLENHIESGSFDVAEFVKVLIPNLNGLIDIYFLEK